MDRIDWKFADRFGSHWVAVKFHKEKPHLKEEAEKIKGVSFCEAVKKAIMHPILLDRNSISCEGAQYALGWKFNYKKEFLNNCQDKNQVQMKNLKSMLSDSPYFKKPFEYISLNADGKPDLVVSFMTPEEVKEVIKIYNYHSGDSLDVSLSSMMPICSGIAVKSYLEKKISISFGCDNSRKFTDIGRDRLAVGIPRKLFKTFID